MQFNIIQTGKKNILKLPYIPDRFARESALEALARKDVTTHALS